jgi:hypothetical protein
MRSHQVGCHKSYYLVFKTFYNSDFFCVDVVYSGEYDVCDVTLSVHVYPIDGISTPGKLENDLAYCSTTH